MTTPKDKKEIKLPKLVREFQKIMKEKGITKKDLLRDLRETRKNLYIEKYRES